MNSIKMVDLQRQHQKIRTEIDSTISKIIESSAFIKGADVHLFENSLSNYLKVNHVIGCANGTDALQIALMALDLKPGDEIIAPAFTFQATAEVVALLGLTLRLADVDERTFNISPDSIEKAITPRTRAIIPVHLFGQSANMNAIGAIAQKNSLYVIEDNAQSLGSLYKINESYHQAGTLGHIGCTSFFPTKNLGGMGDGGALFTNDNTLGARIRAIANHGMFQRYKHEMIGVNSRLDTLQAAILNIKLTYLDEYLAARQKVAKSYFNQLSGINSIILPISDNQSVHTYNQFTIQVEGEGKRDALKSFLAEQGIPSMIYYPTPVHLQPAYQFFGYKEGDLPVSEKLSHKVLSLPMHPELEEEQISYICEAIKTFSCK
jgi:UDP-2-acetamido-2-deoxy-ribo-hexuluronate aminotransferase